MFSNCLLHTSSIQTFKHSAAALIRVRLCIRTSRRLRDIIAALNTQGLFLHACSVENSSISGHHAVVPACNQARNIPVIDDISNMRIGLRCDNPPAVSCCDLGSLVGCRELQCTVVNQSPFFKCLGLSSSLWSLYVCHLYVRLLQLPLLQSSRQASALALLMEMSVFWLKCCTDGLSWNFVQTNLLTLVILWLCSTAVKSVSLFWKLVYSFLHLWLWRCLWSVTIILGNNYGEWISECNYMKTTWLNYLWFEKSGNSKCSESLFKEMYILTENVLDMQTLLVKPICNSLYFCLSYLFILSHHHISSCWHCWKVQPVLHCT